MQQSSCFDACQFERMICETKFFVSDFLGEIKTTNISTKEAVKLMLHVEHHSIKYEYILFSLQLYKERKSIICNIKCYCYQKLCICQLICV